MISFVRTELSSREYKLKEELEKLGADVFLDKDDIVGGENWVKKLNDAVNECHIFVPIICKSYGEFF